MSVRAFQAPSFRFLLLLAVEMEGFLATSASFEIVESLHHVLDDVERRDAADAMDDPCKYLKDLFHSDPAAAAAPSVAPPAQFSGKLMRPTSKACPAIAPKTPPKATAKEKKFQKPPTPPRATTSRSSDDTWKASDWSGDGWWGGDVKEEPSDKSGDGWWGGDVKEKPSDKSGDGWCRGWTDVKDEPSDTAGDGWWGGWPDVKEEPSFGSGEGWKPTWKDDQIHQWKDGSFTTRHTNDERHGAPTTWPTRGGEYGRRSGGSNAGWHRQYNHVKQILSKVDLAAWLVEHPHPKKSRVADA